MRVFHYAYDYHGVGHLQRALTLAEQVSFEFPEATQLVVTGIPQPRNTKLPLKLDMIKLPGTSLPFQGEYYGSAAMPAPPLREAIILNALRHFEPDVVFMDEPSTGAQGEMGKALAHLKLERPETKLVVRLHRIEDDTKMISHTLFSKNSMASSRPSRKESAYYKEAYEIGQRTPKRRSPLTWKN